MQGTIQSEQSLFTRSEDEILEVISGNHVPEYDTSLDVPSLFSTARNIISASFQTIDNLVQVYTVLYYVLLFFFVFFWLTFYSSF